MKNARILVVDDVDSIRKEICFHLKQAGYDVSDAWSLSGAMRLIELVPLDLAIVDLELGDGDGLTLIRSLAEKKVPSMVVSVRSHSDDRVDSLQIGADDYMVKPVDPRELLLRTANILVHHQVNEPRSAAVLELGHIKIDLISRTLISDDRKPVSLSRAELLILRCFLENNKKVVDRATLARCMFKQDNPNSRALDMLVSKLRTKIDLPSRGTHIRSVRGIGYIFDIGVEVVDASLLNQFSIASDAREGDDLT